MGFLCMNDIWLYFLLYRDNFIILQALIASMASYMFRFLENLPLWNANGFIAVLTLHMAVSEPLYYWLHRYLHGNQLFAHYHSLHHSSPVPQSFTGNTNKANISIATYLYFSTWQSVVHDFPRLAYNFLSICCSWKCNIFGASYANCDYWSSDTGGFTTGIWINKHGVRLCLNLWFSSMLGAFQCRSYSLPYFRDCPLSQISSLYTDVSKCSLVPISMHSLKFQQSSLVLAFII